MSFWSRLIGDRSPNFDGETPNMNTPSDVGGGVGVTPGDPDGVQIVGERSWSGPLPWLSPSPWAGWPGDWSTPNWAAGPGASHMGLQRLIDTAWACIDQNANILSSFPPYRLRNGKILPPPGYLINPDDSIYTSWAEFAKQLFWDFQLGEAFVLPMSRGADGYPIKFRVIPPWLVNCELIGGRREYMMGKLDVTDEILHIRNISSTADARGHGPLEAAGDRMVTARLLQRYAHKLAETGGVPHHWLDVPGRRLNKEEATDLLDQWIQSRARHAGGPGVLSGGVELKQANSISARDLSLLELSQFTESRIAILLGMPPFLVGLPMALGEQFTYANATQLFDHHQRIGLTPASNQVMSALSGWLLPRGQSIELNGDAYSQPDLLQRAQAYQIFITTGVLSTQEVRAMERFDGIPSATAALSGAELSGSSDTSVNGDVGAPDAAAQTLQQERQPL